MGVPGFAFYVIVGVAFEELLFRGYLITRLRQAGQSLTFAIVVSSLLFSLGHIYQGWLSIIVTFCLGGVMGASFIKFRSLLPVYAAHLAHDLFLMYGYMARHS